MKKLPWPLLYEAEELLFIRRNLSSTRGALQSVRGQRVPRSTPKKTQRASRRRAIRLETRRSNFDSRGGGLVWSAIYERQNSPLNNAATRLRLVVVVRRRRRHRWLMSFRVYFVSQRKRAFTRASLWSTAEKRNIQAAESLSASRACVSFQRTLMDVSRVGVSLLEKGVVSPFLGVQVD